MSVFDNVLKELGWAEGFQIPVANLENQKLQEELAKLTLQRVKVKTNLDNVKNKYENLEKHLKYLQDEQNENQKLTTLYKQQLETETTKLKTRQIENERITKEIQQFGKKLNEIEERQQIKQEQLEKSTNKFERLQSESKWDVEALKVWDESIKKREEDNELIKKFSIEDEIRYNELEAKRSHLENEFAQRQDTIKQLINEIHKYETMVERTGQIIKEQFNEKEDLIKCWKDSVKILKQRNKEIETIQQQIEETQQLVVEHDEKLEEQNEFFRNQLRNNEELERENQRLNGLNSKLRLNSNELAQENLLLYNEADIMRGLVTTTANQLDRQRKELQSIKRNIEMKQQYIDRYEKIVEKLKIKLNDIEKSSITSSERYKHLEKLLNFEIKQESFLIKNIESLQFAHFKDNEEYRKQLDKAKTIEYELNGAITATKNLRKRNKDTEKDIEKFNELICNMELKIEQIQDKITKIQSTNHDKEDEESLIKVKELEEKLNELTQMRNLLNEQLAKIRSDHRRLQQQLQTDHDKIIVLESKLNTQLLNIEGGEKQLTQHRSNYQQLQVDESILNLRIINLEKLLKNTNNSIYTSQKYRLNLEQLMMERLLEINKNQEILQNQRRTLLDDKSRLKCDLNERQARLEQLKKKYDLIMMCLGKNDTNNVSVTYLKIKNAQEKYMLQQQGDELDKKIRKTEQEIVAMENTLKIVNKTNAAFKNSLSAVEDQDDEMNEMKQLNRDILQINDNLRQSRKDLKLLKDYIDQLKNDYQILIGKNQEISSDLENLQQRYKDGLKDQEMKQTKILRAENCLKILKKRLNHNKIKLDLFEDDFRIRQLRQCNSNALESLMELQNHYKEVTSLIENYQIIYNFRLPEKSGDSSNVSTTRSTSSSSSKSSKNKRTVSLSKLQLTLNI